MNLFMPVHWILDSLHKSGIQSKFDNYLHHSHRDMTKLILESIELQYIV